MAVMREDAISAFKPELFSTVQIGLDGFTAASERFKTKAAAEAVKQSCSVAIVQKAECKEKTEKPPALYDLTSLQREANRVLGYTAHQTFDYTQNLYEKKLGTYPRTDSRFLTEDMAHSLTDLVKLAFHTFPVEDVDNIPVHAEQVVNNKKVTDHHAIIPTRELQKCNLSELPKGELAILQLISNRLCVAVGDPHRYAETGIERDCGGNVFTTKGKKGVHTRRNEVPDEFHGKSRTWFDEQASKLLADGSIKRLNHGNSTRLCPLEATVAVPKTAPEEDADCIVQEAESDVPEVAA